MESKYKKILLVVIALLVVFFAFDYNYLLANFSYFFQGHTTFYQKSVYVKPDSSKIMEPNRLVIDSLSITAPVIYAEEKTEAAFQTALAEGVVHYPGTANPGKAGNCYIFGHSSDYVWNKGKYKNIFALLTKIKKGDSILISDQEGRAYLYTVTGTKVVAPSDLSVLDQQNYQKKLLTLQTSYPLGTALKRFIVTAEME